MLLTGTDEANDLSPGALRRFTQCRWIGHTTFQLWGALFHWIIAAPAKFSSPMPRCHVMLWCAVGALLRNQRYEITDLASRYYLPWYNAKLFFIRFWAERQYKPRTTGYLTLASLPSNIIYVLCLKDVCLRWLKWPCLARKVYRTGAQLPTK